MTEVGTDWIRRFGHLLQGRLLNRPHLLARLLRLAQSAGMAIACSYREVRDVCLRTAAFSNLALADKLVAGDFVIGMDSGPVHARERAAARDPLQLADFGGLAAREAQSRIAMLEGRGAAPIDIVDEYLVYVAWAGLGGIFDAAALRAIEGDGPAIERDAALQVLFRELRHVGGHLVVGGRTAPQDVQVRAAACAAALNGRIDRALSAIVAHWSVRCPHAAASAHRQAVGLVWVGHPAMVQAGALVYQGLRERDADYAQLRSQAGALGPAAYADAALRRQVLGHVLECLRHRPPFPVLPRLAPRDTELRLGGKPGRREKPPALVAAGSPVALGLVAALHRLAAGDGYSPQQALDLWDADPDALPLFGIGPRNCIARREVVELLVSAVIGLLQLPELVYADPWWRRIAYDGPIITRLRVRMKASGAGGATPAGERG